MTTLSGSSLQGVASTGWEAGRCPPPRVRITPGNSVKVQTRDPASLSSGSRRMARDARRRSGQIGLWVGLAAMHPVGLL